MASGGSGCDRWVLEGKWGAPAFCSCWILVGKWGILPSAGAGCWWGYGGSCHLQLLDEMMP